MGQFRSEDASATETSQEETSRTDTPARTLISPTVDFVAVLGLTLTAALSLVVVL